MTTMTPNETSPDQAVEAVARAVGLSRYKEHKPPVRWPLNPKDFLSDRDGTVPLTWDYAEMCRAEARIALAAITPPPADRTDLIAGEEVEDLLADAIDDSLDMDWTSRLGARSIVRELDKLGLRITYTEARADLVARLRNPTHEELEKLSEPWCCNVDEMNETWHEMLDTLGIPEAADALEINNRTIAPTCATGWKPMHEGCPVCGPNGPCEDSAYEALIQAEKRRPLARLRASLRSIFSGELG